MNSRIRFALVLLILFVLLDLYAFRGFNTLTASVFEAGTVDLLKIAYWALSALIIAGILYFMRQMASGEQKEGMRTAYRLFGINILVFVPKLFFMASLVLHDITTGIAALFNASFQFTGILWGGFAIATFLFLEILYGILKGRFAYRVIKQPLTFKNFPKAFNGLKVVQISDIHIGSFFDHKKEVEQAIQMINDLEPDLILFTGDLVNNVATETDGWVPIFQQLNARIAKYSILGNHDYGDYLQWPTPEAKQANLDALKAVHEAMGFKLLLNEFESIDREGEAFSIIGVENWGLPPFPQYGNLNEAMRGAEDSPFKLLLSHDPSHWDAQVTTETNIDLTLSGHTHGMQFGIEIGKFKWSPVKFKYPRWAGLYTKGKQLLYVNRGFGFIGFPGRVGMKPEITLFELSQG